MEATHSRGRISKPNPDVSDGQLRRRRASDPDNLSNAPVGVKKLEKSNPSLMDPSIVREIDDFLCDQQETTFNFLSHRKGIRGSRI